MTTPEQRRILERLARMNKVTHERRMFAQMRELARQRREGKGAKNDASVRNAVDRPTAAATLCTKTKQYAQERYYRIWAFLIGAGFLGALLLVFYAIW